MIVVKRNELLYAPSYFVNEYRQVNENNEILSASSMKFPSLDYDDLSAQYIDQAYNACLLIDLIKKTEDMKESCLNILEKQKARVVVEPQSELGDSDTNSAISN